MNLLNFSDRLQAAMDAEGLRQTDLAAKVGLSRAAINQVIAGTSKGMKPENLVAVARALRVRIEWLATGEEPMRGAISSDEWELLEGYRSMPQPEKAATLTLFARGRTRSVTGAVRAVVSDQPPRPAYPGQERRAAHP